MRYVTTSILLAVLAFTCAQAQAEPVSKAVNVPSAAVISIMKGAGQALLWDGKRGEYVVVRVGDSVQDCRVSAIESGHVVLTRNGTNEHYVLTRTTDKPGAPGKTSPAAPAPWPAHSQEAGTAAELIDPYPAPLTVVGDVKNLAVLDPYGTSGPVNTVTAPQATTVRAPSAEKPQAPRIPSAGTAKAPATPSVAGPVEAPPKTSAKPRVLTQRQTVSRREFDAAVTDFHSLGKEVQMSLGSDGVHIADVARGSMFYRLGLRAGDVVLDVDGRQIRGVDDAAALYARLMDAKKFQVRVKRGVDTVVMHYRFRK